VFITDCLIPDLKETSEPTCMEETGEDRKLHNKEVFNLHCSLYIVREIKSLMFHLKFHSVKGCIKTNEHTLNTSDFYGKLK
jgi:hypothetical protein